MNSSAWVQGAQQVQSQGRSASVELIGTSKGSIRLDDKFLTLVEIVTELSRAEVHRLVHALVDEPVEAGRDVCILGQITQKKVNMPFTIVEGTEVKVAKDGEDNELFNENFILDCVEGLVAKFAGTLDHSAHGSRCACSITATGYLMPVAGGRTNKANFNAIVGNNIPIQGMLKYVSNSAQMQLQPGNPTFVIGHLESIASEPIYAEGAQITEQGNVPCIVPLKHMIVIDSFPNSNRNRNRGWQNSPTLLQMMPNTQAPAAGTAAQTPTPVTLNSI